MSECFGQTEYGYHSKRVHRVTDNVMSAMTNILAYERDGLDLTDANWEKHVFNPVPFVPFK